MRRLEEHRRVDKQLSASVPLEVLKQHGTSKDGARLSCPPGWRLIKGLRDEALSGEWKGHHSSRPGLQWRVTCRLAAGALLTQVIHVTPHDSRRP
jgi:hypothetical protein